MKKINVLMLIALLFLAFSCRTGIEADSISDSAIPHKNSSKIKFQQFQSETQIKDFSTFLDLSSEKRKTAAHKNGNILAAYNIDTENINKLDFSNHQTYTFRAYNIFESPENIYNVLYYKGKTKWEFSLFKIIRNPQNKTERIIPIYDSSVGEITTTENPVSGKTSCMADIYFTEFHCTCPPSWGSCDLCGECVSETHSTVLYDCGGGAGNPVFNTSPSGLPIIYPGTVHDTNNPPAYTPIPQNPSPYYFDPNIPPSIDAGYVRAVRSDNFWSQLDNNGKNWEQQNPETYNALLENYLTHYTIPNNTANLQFHNWAISFLNENPTTTWEQFQNWFIKADGSPKIIINTNSNSNALTFNNMEEFKNYIVSFKDSFIPDSSSLESINNTNITKFKAKFDILVPVYLNIHAKSILENPNTYATEFDLLEVNSFKSGISTFLTWNQDSYSHNVDGHVVEINLNGHFDIGVKIGDLDFTYADSYIIKAKYNNITGNAMSISGTPD
ncbi:hypothetical protein N0B16_06660 [Chryseobacterium sp. GMJ5]|uniref:Uncharacterized protein n=1 Tax=Chryseobacterium gilvum TaxID=2976534 RepID=A0ABT2VWV7_9FLAO|nr:hypothetical protein [Chryseobacterium gilvum]MCU7614114.1 hypothetical protein [Chryseobacterium gilvum]